jgi:hypothetical protein
MNRRQALGRTSLIAFLVGLVFFALAGELMYSVPINDVLLCARADGQCLVKHRTILKSRSGAIPLAAITGAELRPGRRRGADRLELWVTAGRDAYWLTDYAVWQRPEAQNRLTTLQRFISDPAIPRVEVRRDFLGGPIGTLAALLVGVGAVTMGWRVRFRVPGEPE